MRQRQSSPSGTSSGALRGDDMCHQVTLRRTQSLKRLSLIETGPPAPASVGENLQRATTLTNRKGCVVVNLDCQNGNTP